MNLSRLEKVWALTTSPVAGEAAAALERARFMVEAAGRTLADVPVMLNGLASSRARSPMRKPAWWDAEHEARMGKWAENKRRWDEGIARFGEPEILHNAEIGRIVRAALKLKFPGVKFRVRTVDNFVVEWIDGPPEAEVESFVAQFRPGRAWLWRLTIVRAPLGSGDDYGAVWADPPPKPHPYARLVWFNQFRIMCFRSDGSQI